MASLPLVARLAFWSFPLAVWHTLGCGCGDLAINHLEPSLGAYPLLDELVEWQYGTQSPPGHTSCWGRCLYSCPCVIFDVGGVMHRVLTVDSMEVPTSSPPPLAIAAALLFGPKPIRTISGGFGEQISRFEFDFCRPGFFFERFEFLVCSKFNHKKCGRTCACAVACLHPINSISNVVASVTIHDNIYIYVRCSKTRNPRGRS